MDQAGHEVTALVDRTVLKGLTLWPLFTYEATEALRV
jgi:hypothetical protein